MTDINVGALSEAINDKLDRDAGNANSQGVERVVGWGMPDYSAGVALIKTANYQNVISNKGYVLFNAEHTAGDDKAYIKNDADSVPYQTAACHHYESQYYDGSHNIVPVDVGNIVYNTSGVIDMTFFPMKGNN